MAVFAIQMDVQTAISDVNIMRYIKYPNSYREK